MVKATFVNEFTMFWGQTLYQINVLIAAIPI